MSQVSEQRRDQIIQTARHIVDQHGPARLTAEAITQGVGVSRPLLYHYFENMGDLLDAVMALYTHEFEERLCAWEKEEETLPHEGDAWAASLVNLLRAALIDECPLVQGTVGDECPPSYATFLARCADIAAAHAQANGSAAVWAVCRTVPDPRATMRYTVMGIAGTLRAFPDLADGEAVRLFAAPWATPRIPSPAGVANDYADDGDPAELEEPLAKKGLFGRIFR